MAWPENGKKLYVPDICPVHTAFSQNVQTVFSYVSGSHFILSETIKQERRRQYGRFRALPA